VQVNMLSQHAMIYSHDIQKLINGNHHDPHTFLGIHPLSSDCKVIRLWNPGASFLYLEVDRHIVEAIKVHEAGLFEYIVDRDCQPQHYRVYHKNSMLAHDPYTFLPTFGELDQYFFSKGVHYQLALVLGGRLAEINGISGVKFSVWAPGARSVALVGDFNHWDGRINPMRSLGHSGVWEIFVPGLKTGEKYKFEIKTQTGEVLIKTDPMGYLCELRPQTASVIADLDRFIWSDEKWIEERKNKRHQPQAINIYEVHLGSWKKDHGYFINYRQIAKELVNYCKEMGFTHVELMPVQEHPLDESWGYQVSGFYAVTSRFGSPEDFQWFVNHFHENDIGVILDWVPGHFPTDISSLGRFDGTALYEHDDPKQGVHPHWGTYIFNFGRHEVANFLIANALFWLEQMHVDGLRVDAVASMLYLDYGRKEGEWIPNRYGGKENIDAIDFFKHLHSIVHNRNPGVLMIAEESTSFGGVTAPLQHNGLGFDMKWNMGWMNDTLRYFSTDTLFRKYHQNELTFGLLYAFSERFLLVLSHDEVVHGKSSLLNKMPGDSWQKFANLRLLLSYMMCQPGKKLLFMGGEIGQGREWNCKAEIEWWLLQYPPHAQVQLMVKELNHLYKKTKSLWEIDFHYTGFEWIDFADQNNSVISYLRKGSQDTVLCVHNFTPTFYPHYHIKLNNCRQVVEIFNSDEMKYGGSGKLNPDVHVSHGITISLAPLATMIFQVKK